MTDWIALMEDHWAWLVFAALLGIGEVLIPGVFLIWIAIAAAITRQVTISGTRFTLLSLPGTLKNL